MKKDLKNSIRNLKKNKDYVGADDPTVYAESVESKRSNRFMCVRPISKRNTQRGITLVALVITIIILLILAMVSIKIVLDGGLITKASKATDTHTIGAEKEAIQLAYNTYQIAKIQDKDYTMQKALDEQKANATATDIEDGWLIIFEGKEDSPYTLKEDGTIIEGEQQVELLEDSLAKAYVDGKLKLGDEVAYTPENGHSYTSEKWDEADNGCELVTTYQSLSTDDYETNSGSKSTKWKVIGVNTKTGTVNLISAEQLKVKKASNGSFNTYRICGKKGYNSGVNELNKMCSVFGYGNGATGARSVNVDDLDKALNYNKKDFVYTDGDDTEKINFKYGWTTTYYGKRTTWNPRDTFEIKDTSKLDENGDYQREGSYATFIDINGNVATDANPITITSSLYIYTKDQFTDRIESNILNMIFGESKNFDFWLASRYVYGDLDGTSWGLFSISSGELYNTGMYSSDDSKSSSDYYVRPVVSLKSNIQGEKDASGIWQLK